jgi:molecular chaperone GrpE (heat shock protein)
MSNLQDEISELVRRVKTGAPFESLAAARKLAEVTRGRREATASAAVNTPQPNELGRLLASLDALIETQRQTHDDFEAQRQMLDGLIETQRQMLDSLKRQERDSEAKAVRV